MSIGSPVALHGGRGFKVPKKQPTVGVVILAYNQARYIRESVDSVINQTYAPSQIIICDDASTDGTQDIVQEYEKEYRGLIEALYRSNNVGVSANLNSGLVDYLSVNAGDDTWDLDKLRLEIERLQSVPGARWAYSRSVIINEVGREVKPFALKFDGQEGDILCPVLTHRMTARNWLVETSLMREVGPYDEKLLVYEDWDLKI